MFWHSRFWKKPPLTAGYDSIRTLAYPDTFYLIRQLFFINFFVGIRCDGQKTPFFQWHEFDVEATEKSH